ncbi:hypothetical protein ACVW0I_007678 [Bradyrhizobium sp. LM6.11]
MPLNNGKPIIGRLARAGLGFLLSVAGWPVAVSWGSRSQTTLPQMPPPHLLILTRASPAWVCQVPSALCARAAVAPSSAARRTMRAANLEVMESPEVERLHSSLAG